MLHFTISSNEIIHQLKLSCQIPTVVEGILTRQIVIQKAAEVGIKIEVDELQQAADSLRVINNLRSADATLSWLEKYSLTLDDFEEAVYISVLSSKLANHLFAKQAELYFGENKLDYAQCVIYEVVLDDQDLAMELYYSLLEGEINFHEVAHQYIQDTELRRCGGYRGLLKRADLKPEISAAVFAATLPQILKPIVTSSGMHLILVEEVIQPQLNDNIRLQIISDLFSNWIKQQVADVQVELQLNNSEQVLVSAGV